MSKSIFCIIGIIDNFIVWNRTLSSGEIHATYGNEKIAKQWSYTTGDIVYTVSVSALGADPHDRITIRATGGSIRVVGVEIAITP